MYAAPRLLSRAASVDLSGEPPCRGVAAMRASPTRMTLPDVRKSLRIMRQRRTRRGGCPHPPSRAKLGRRSASCARLSGRRRPGLRVLIGSSANNGHSGLAVGLRCYHALGFPNRDRLPGADVGQLVHLSAGPLYFNRVSFRLRAQAERQHQFAL